MSGRNFLEVPPRLRKKLITEKFMKELSPAAPEMETFGQQIAIISELINGSEPNQVAESNQPNHSDQQDRVGKPNPGIAAD